MSESMVERQRVIESFKSFIAKESRRTKKAINLAELSETAYLDYAQRWEEEARYPSATYKKLAYYFYCFLGIAYIFLIAGALSFIMLLAICALGHFYFVSAPKATITLVILGLLSLCISGLCRVWYERHVLEMMGLYKSTISLKEEYGRHYMSIIVKYLAQKSE